MGRRSRKPPPPPPPAPTPPLLAPADLAGIGGSASTNTAFDTPIGTFDPNVQDTLNTLSLGMLYQGTSGSATPAETAARAQATAAEQANKALKLAGVDVKIPVDPQGQFRVMLQAAGVDVTNPAVMIYISQQASTVMAADYDQGILAATVSGLAKTYPAPQAPGATDYKTALTTYGFSAGYGDYTSAAAGLDPNATGAPRMGREGDTPAAIRDITTDGYIINSDNGAVLYKNGVIFDPTNGDLHFPQADPNIVGSAAWLHSVTKWSPEKVQEWRTKLGQMGYFSDVSQALNGSGSVDATFLDAVQRYQTSRYQNYGTPIAISNVDLSKYGPNGNKLVDLNQIRATIVSQVRTQYRTTFGQEPSSGELKRWTDFVINTGMEAQRQGVDAGSAEANALAQFENKTYASPQGQYLQTQAEENTSLANALSSAVAATASVTR